MGRPPGGAASGLEQTQLCALVLSRTDRAAALNIRAGKLGAALPGEMANSWRASQPASRPHRQTDGRAGGN